tara:strand:+ start:745 stop:1212 length:468 start_codon:yes stop_codon:yes gene_type:complete
MATQKFLSDLWSRYGLIYKNENIFTSHNSEPTSQSSTTLTSQPSNPDQSVIQGAKAHSYQSPVQEIYIYPPTTPPVYFQRNEMNPLQQKEQNLAMETIARADPRIDKSGKFVEYPNRLANMDIQILPFNYPAIIGIFGILAAVFAVVWLAKGKRN